MDKIAPWPYYTEDEISAVNEVLNSGRVNAWTGETVNIFEDKFASYLGVNHAVAVANGTLALELALKSIDIRVGDEVIVPCRTFIATASAVVNMGAIPVIADVDYETQNISVNEILPAITDKTKAIIVVHLSGLSCDMDPIMALAQEKGIKVIEDCAQAHGARYKNKPCGSIGDVAAFSFCQDKIMSTGGEGGMLVTNDYNIWSLAWSYKDHGKNYNKAYDGKVSTEYKWLHDSVGTNFRMTCMQAAIGICQLEKLDDWVACRQKNANILSKYLEQVEGISVLRYPKEYKHSYYKYYFNLNSNMYSKNSILKGAAKKKIPIMSGICHDISNEQAMINCNSIAMDHPNASRLKETSIMVMVHPTITNDEMILIAKEIVSIFR